MWLFRRRVNMPVLAALGVVLISLCGVPPAGAYIGRDAKVRAVLDKVPAQLHELSVQLATLVAPQLRVTNPTDTPIEVLDPTGVPFISIGPQGVLGNLNAPSWYTTYDPSGRTPVPEDVRRREAAGAPVESRWSRITPQRSWGWFDHRLQQESPVVSPEVVKAGVAADLGTWAVPVRYGGKTLQLSGRFVYQPVRGTFEYFFEEGKEQVELDPGLTLTLRPGGPDGIPTLTLKSTLPKRVVVYGIENEPFLGFSDKGVRVNRLSPTWLQIQRVRGQAMPDAKADPAVGEAEQVADQPEFEWPELRALYGQPEPPENVISSDRPVDVLEWWVRFTIGERNEVLIAHSGKTRWVPAARSPEVQVGGGGISATVVGIGLAVLGVTVAGLLVFLRRRHPRRTG